MDRFARLPPDSECVPLSEAAGGPSGVRFAKAAGAARGPLAGAADRAGKRIPSGWRRSSGQAAATTNGRAPLGYEDVLGGPPLLTESIFAAQAQSFDDRASDSSLPTKAFSSDRIQGRQRVSSSLPVFGASIYDDVFHGASAGGSMQGRLSEGMERKGKANLRTSSLHSIPLNSYSCSAEDSASDESIITCGSFPADESRSSGDEVPSQQPGFCNSAVQKDRDKSFRVPRSLSAVCTSFSDLNPFNYSSCTSNMKSISSSKGTPDISPEIPSSSFIKSMKSISDLSKRSESEDLTQRSGYKKLPAEETSARINQSKLCFSSEAGASAKDSSVLLESRLVFQSNGNLAETSSDKIVRNLKSKKVEEIRNDNEIWTTRDVVKLMTNPSSQTCPPRSPPLSMFKQMPISRKPEDDKDEHVTFNADKKFHKFQSSTSMLWPDAKQGVTYVLDVNHAEVSSYGVAASTTAIKEAMERTTLKLKLAKEARKWGKEECEIALNTSKCWDERETVSEGGKKQRKEIETNVAYVSEEMQKEDTPPKKREWMYKKREWELGRESKEHGVESEFSYSYASELKKQTEIPATEVYEITLRLDRARANTCGWAVEREKNAVKKVMNEVRTRVEHAALDPGTKEACEQIVLRAEVERVATEAREISERVAAAVRKQQNQQQQQQQQRKEDSFLEEKSQFSSTLRQSPTTMDASRSCKSDGTSSEHQRYAETIDVKKKITSVDDPIEFRGEPSEHLGTHQRLQEGVAKDLQENKQHDLQSQTEELERHRASEMFDIRIKHWAAGRRGNLRKLLCDLHSVIWLECGWQPVSMMDLITVEAVKKAYRKATLCVHPDKLQQKGATTEQKYKAEKIFELLKEAWNKFQYREVPLQPISS